MIETKFVRVCKHEIEEQYCNELYAYSEAMLVGYVEMSKSGKPIMHNGILGNDSVIEIFVENLDNELIALLNEKVIIIRFAAGKIEFERKANVTIYFHHYIEDFESFQTQNM